MNTMKLELRANHIKGLALYTLLFVLIYAVTIGMTSYRSSGGDWTFGCTKSRKGI